MSTLSSVKRSVNKSAVQVNTFSSDKDFYFFHSDGNDYKISFGGQNSSLKAYMKCPPLSAIINKKAQAYINGKTWILNKKGKARDKEASGEVATKVRSLMANPNPFQGQKEFEAQLYTYVQLWGWSIVFFGGKPVGFQNYEAKRMWNICPAMVNIKETEKNWLDAEGNSDLIKKIVIDFGGEKSELPLDACYIVKDSSISFGNPLFPQSRTESLEYPINNTIGAYESRGKLIDYRGALGIISPDSKDVAGPVKLQDEDKEAVQNDFLRYGTRKGQFSFIISSASVKWTQMGIPTRDLMLFEEIEDNIMRICDAYNYPYPLMSSNRTNSLGGNNIDASIRYLYQDAIIPEAENMCEQWDKIFSLYKYDLFINKDYSHIAALQDDKLQNARWRNTLNDAKKKEYDSGLITLNDWLIALGEDPLSDEFGNVRVTDVKNSTVPLAVTIGTGGVQGLISVITAAGMSQEARQATLEIVFGLSAEDAKRMAIENTGEQSAALPA